VQREAEPALHAGNKVFLTAICFDALEAGERLAIESAIRGERIGTRVSALAAIPGSAAEPEVDEPAEPEPEAAPEDRRSAPRQVYGRAVQVLGEGELMLGRDLSMSGVRLEDGDGLEEGTRVCVALFGTPRDEPVVVEAIVTRARPGAEMALQFSALSSTQAQDLEKLMRATPILDALDQPTAEAGRTVVAELRESRRPS